MSSIKIEVPALVDGHGHLREVGPVMAALIALAVAGGAEVIGAMPNTNEGLRTADQVMNYAAAAQEFADPQGVTIMPFVMITEKTTTDELRACHAAGIRHVKIYPLDRTTQSENGVFNYIRILPLVKLCGELGIMCHFHPEHPWLLFKNADAEYVFLSIVKMFLDETSATIVWEHGTDARCIRFWKEMAKSGRFFVTLTAHHLATSEDGVYGDVRAVCKPSIKGEDDRLGLIGFVAEDHDWVMAGGDSAYHPMGKKHVDKGCCACGSLTAFFLMPLYAHALGPVLRLETPRGVEIFKRFTNGNARRTHKLPESKRLLTLAREPMMIPLQYKIADEIGLPFWAGRKIDWKIEQQAVL